MEDDARQPELTDEVLQEWARIARIPANKTTDFCSGTRLAIHCAWLISDQPPVRVAEALIDQLTAVKNSASRLADDLACLDIQARSTLASSLAVNAYWPPGDLTKDEEKKCWRHCLNDVREQGISEAYTVALCQALATDLAAAATAPILVLKKRRRGRPLEDWSPFQQFVWQLLTAANGELSFNKNDGSGTLEPLLEAVRPFLPAGLVPNAFSRNTLYAIRRDWMKNHRRSS